MDGQPEGTTGYFNHLGLKIDAGVDEVHIFQTSSHLPLKGLIVILISQYFLKV
jgi:hypothetical protein